MVQGRLLTSHSGGVHGGGEVPGGQSSIRQGAEKWSSRAPNLRSAAAAEQRGNRDAGFSSRVSWTRGKNRPKGAPKVGPTSQAPWWCGQGWGRATWLPGRG